MHEPTILKRFLLVFILHKQEDSHKQIFCNRDKFAYSSFMEFDERPANTNSQLLSRIKIILLLDLTFIFRFLFCRSFFLLFVLKRENWISSIQLYAEEDSRHLECSIKRENLARNIQRSMSVVNGCLFKLNIFMFEKGQ